MNRPLRLRSLLLLQFLALPCLLLSTCSRRAEIFDEPDSGIATDPNGPMRDKPYASVDAGLDDSALPACSERSEGGCRGPNDFPCDFGSWLSGVVEACRDTSECRPNGWLSAETGADGCLLRLEVTEQNPVYSACVSERLRQVRCPCPATRFELFLGTRNAACPDPTPRPCQTGEFACDSGEICVNDVCVRDGAGGAP